MTLADTHCHLYFNAFDPDRDAVIQRAIASGVTRMLVPGISLETSREAIALAEATPEIYAAVGIHPTETASWDSHTLEALREMTRHPKVVAIGEIGLDYYWDSAPREKQRKALQAQLRLAAETGLPVSLHLREKEDALDGDCTRDMLDILSDWIRSLNGTKAALAARPGVLHSFSGTVETATAAYQMGFYTGITAPVTFKNAKKRQEIVAQLPLERLLLETDAPFLSPHPYRGKRNEPARIALIAEKVAALHSIARAEVDRQTTANAARLFNW